mmetsp:Transcript_57263/g.95158  ORF Transcript_57263/g.95158 Transcript_57263/m.95158 type:complete len:302 (+) Transcript_57263:89-994(+)
MMPKLRELAMHAMIAIIVCLLSFGVTADAGTSQPPCDGFYIGMSNSDDRMFQAVGVCKNSYDATTGEIESEKVQCLPDGSDVMMQVYSGADCDESNLDFEMSYSEILAGHGMTVSNINCCSGSVCDYAIYRVFEPNPDGTCSSTADDVSYADEVFYVDVCSPNGGDSTAISAYSCTDGQMINIHAWDQQNCTVPDATWERGVLEGCQEHLSGGTPLVPDQSRLEIICGTADPQLCSTSSPTATTEEITTTADIDIATTAEVTTTEDITTTADDDSADNGDSAYQVPILMSAVVVASLPLFF